MSRDTPNLDTVVDSMLSWIPCNLDQDEELASIGLYRLLAQERPVSEGCLAARVDISESRVKGILQDTRVRHVDDAERRIGRMVAASGGHRNRTAWDIFLFYDGKAEWTPEELPKPLDWTDPDRHGTGEDLVNGVRSAMKRFNEREM